MAVPADLNHIVVSKGFCQDLGIVPWLRSVAQVRQVLFGVIGG